MKIIEYINKFFKKFEKKEDIVYGDLDVTRNLCIELGEITKKRINLLYDVEKLKEDEKEYTKYNRIKKNDLQHIDILIETHMKISEKKSKLEASIKSYNNRYDYLEKYEDEISKNLKEMETYEDKKGKVFNNMGYIEGEKADLINTKEQIEGILSFLKYFKYFYVIALSLSIFILVILYSYYNRDIALHSIIVSVVAIIMGSLIYFTEKRLSYERIKNVKLQDRAVTLLNKEKIKYVHFKGFLDYEYSKYKVNSVDNLRYNFDEYTKNKINLKELKRLNGRKLHIEEEIDDILAKYDIDDSELIGGDLYSITNIDKAMKEHKKLLNNIDELEKKLSILDEEQKKIWDKLEILKENDYTENKNITKIIDETLENLDINI